MLTKLVHSVAVVGGCAIAAIVAPAQAQLVVTGGTINFQGTQIYVPNVDSRLRAVIYNGSASVLVRTPNISINDNVLLRGGILPTLNTCACDIPRVGDTGTWLPTLNFVAFSNTGEPTVFRNIPAELNFRVDSLQPTGPAAPINRFESPLVLLTETGSAVNASSFGGVARTTPVVVVEFGQFPSTQLQAFGIANVTPGINYPGNINATITDGTVSAPLANSFSATPPPATGAANNGNNGSFVVTSSTFVGAFNSVTSIVSVYGPTPGAAPDGNTRPEDTPQERPRPDEGRRPRPDEGEQNGERDDDDDDETIFVDRNRGTRVVIVGLPSRVFPGLIGIESIRETPRTAQQPADSRVLSDRPSQQPPALLETTLSETAAIEAKTTLPAP
ncbi:MAG: hypothetical protein NW220_02250 [Leptolyngbyaceae cyanobacterium bins.349]|nr:hypothetical protein [Leptolyngbyaceae cyanobacterium bins.349]